MKPEPREMTSEEKIDAVYEAAVRWGEPEPKKSKNTVNYTPQEVGVQITLGYGGSSVARIP